MGFIIVFRFRQCADCEREPLFFKRNKMNDTTIYNRIKALEAAVKLAKDLYTEPHKIKECAKVFYGWIIKEDK